jgi:hypothetical protein
LNDDGLLDLIVPVIQSWDGIAQPLAAPCFHFPISTEHASTENQGTWHFFIARESVSLIVTTQRIFSGAKFSWNLQVVRPLAQDTEDLIFVVGIRDLTTDLFLLTTEDRLVLDTTETHNTGIHPTPIRKAGTQFCDVHITNITRLNCFLVLSFVHHHFLCGFKHAVFWDNNSLNRLVHVQLVWNLIHLVGIFCFFFWKF